jgi:ubiquinone/menaquinone biosynthesis C-methylase UbiE
MPDVYIDIAEAEEAVQERIAEILELRAADTQQRAMLEAYVHEIELPQDAQVLDVGSGTGAVSRFLADLPSVGRVTGIDPSPVLVTHARSIGGPLHLSFDQGDGRALPYAEAEFDLVVFHTVLCHVPGVEGALAEAFRVLRPAGQVAIFDGDYATSTVATGDADPLTVCVDAAIEAVVHDRWLVRRVRRLVEQAGFVAGPLRSHGYVEADDPAYMLTLVDRGADALASSGRLDATTAEALKREARHRIRAGTFFGHIAYASIVGRKPGASV